MPVLMKDRLTYLELKIKELQDQIETIQQKGGEPNNKKAIYMRRRSAT